MKNYFYALLLTVVFAPFAYAGPTKASGFTDTQEALDMTDHIFNDVFAGNVWNFFDTPFKDMGQLSEFTKNMTAYIADKAKVLGVTDKTINNAYTKLKTGLIQLPQLIQKINQAIEGKTIAQKYQQFNTSLNTIKASAESLIGAKELQKIADNPIVLPRKKSAVKVIDNLARKLAATTQTVQDAMSIYINR